MKPPRVHAATASTFHLKAALLVYEGKHGAGSYVSAHEIMRGDRGAQLGAGRPLEKQDLRRLLAGAGHDLGMRGWVPDRLLYIGPDMLAWWRAAASAPVFFKSGAIARGARQGVTPQPGLVFAVANRGWYVWATKCAGARPDDSTPLFQAPYLNVYNTGEICEGDVRVPKTLEPETVAGFERAFFESRFTHANAGLLCSHPDGAKGLWNELLDGGHEQFPIDSLLPANVTLGRALKALAGREDYHDD